MRRLTVVVALVLLAGCTGIIQTEEPAPTETETVEPTAVATDATGTATPTPEASTDSVTTTGTTTATAAPSATTTATSTATPTGTTETATPDESLSADNPWGQEIVPVRINDSVNDGRNTTALTVQTIDYWNANIERYTDFEYRFVLADGSADARVEVQFRSTVDSCDGEDTNIAGCASYLTEGTTASDREIVGVESRSSNSAVLSTTRHEFGHLVGLGHSDDPLVLMGQAYDGDIRDAADRSMPWYGDTLHVAVEPDAIDGDPAVIREQVRHAVEYYDDGAEGTVPSNITVTVTDEPDFAEVIVTNETSRGCAATEGSQASVAGRHLDTDGQPELYTRMIVCVGPVGEDAVGWHTGYWLGTAFGLDSGERAPPFQNADYEERRSEWWK